MRKTFSSTKGTPYYRLQHRRATFDAVVALRVEGVGISTDESDHPTELGLSVSANALPCSLGGAAREHLELLRYHYNFVRPHGALKFGRETRTPAMQAGLATPIVDELLAA